jgi:hypothetical protein
MWADAWAWAAASTTAAWPTWPGANWRKPTLLGLAHECQKVERLAQASWDVPLQGTVTDKAWYFAGRRRGISGVERQVQRLNAVDCWTCCDFDRRIGLVGPQALRITGGHDPRPNKITKIHSKSGLRFIDCPLKAHHHDDSSGFRS